MNNTRIFIFVIVLATLSGFCKPVDAQSENTQTTQTNASPYIRPPDAHLTIAQVGLITSNALVASDCPIGDFNQFAPHFVRWKDKITWQVQFSRKVQMPGGLQNPSNNFNVFITDDTGKAQVSPIYLR